MDQDQLAKLRKKGLLIDPDNLDTYLARFKNKKPGSHKIDEKYWKERRVLVTGISGFAGSYLAERLLESGAQVAGLVRRHSVPTYSNITSIMDKVRLFEGNLLDFSSILTLIKQFEPEVIFHLGAQSFVPTSFRTPIETYDTNVMGTTFLFEALRQEDSSIDAVQIACSSEEYGLVYPDEVPIKETNPLRPLSPNAVSKVSMDFIAQTHHRCYGLPTVITRAFNHTGRRRGLQFVTSVVMRQIAKIKAGRTDTLTIGNPEPIRDFTDVRDIVAGYMLAVQSAKKAEPYNLGHGVGISIGGLIELSAKVSGIKKFKVEVDKKRFRPADVPILICDYSNAKERFNYEPTIPLTETLKGMIAFFEENPALLDIERH